MIDFLAALTYDPICTSLSNNSEYPPGTVTSVGTELECRAGSHGLGLGS